MLLARAGVSTNGDAGHMDGLTISPSLAPLGQVDSDCCLDLVDLTVP